MSSSTIGSINLLPEEEKISIYSRVIPQALLDRFHLPGLESQRIRSLMRFRYAPGSTDVEFSLFHSLHAPDPILFGHLTDTISGQVHVLLYILNDPDTPRFNVDIMPDGRSTRFGTLMRNLEAEKAAMDYGLAPGQIHRGLRMLGEALSQFENFIASLGHEMYFVEPLHYHNAVIFERYGFAYEMGRKLMERIEKGFSEPSDLSEALASSSSPFRQPGARNSIRLRSWAIHDGLLGEPFSGVTMYKRLGKSAGINTCPNCEW